MAFSDIQKDKPSELAEFLVSSFAYYTEEASDRRATWIEACWRMQEIVDIESLLALRSMPLKERGNLAADAVAKSSDPAWMVEWMSDVLIFDGKDSNRPCKRHRSLRQRLAAEDLDSFASWYGLDVKNVHLVPLEDRRRQFINWPPLYFWANPRSQSLAEKVFSDAPLRILLGDNERLDEQRIELFCSAYTPPHVKHAQRNVSLAILRSAMHAYQTLQPVALRQLLASAHLLPSLEELISMDGETLRSWLPLEYKKETKHSRVIDILVAAKRQPELDPSGRFSSHLHILPTSLMDSYPVLWSFDQYVGKMFLDKLGSPDDRRLLSIIAQRFLRMKLNYSEREEWRTAGCVGHVLQDVINGLRAVFPDPQRTINRLISLTAERRRLLRTVALVTARQNQLRQGRNRTVQVSKSPNRFLTAINSWISWGIFKCVNPSNTISPKEINKAMRRFEKKDRSRFRSSNAEISVRRKDPITDEDAEAVMAIAESRNVELKFAICTQYCAVFWLLYTTGLRGGAIANLKLSDVWDEQNQKVYRQCNVSEKFSSRRTIPRFSKTEEALREYIQVRSPRLKYLFGVTKNPKKKNHHLAGQAMLSMCKKAGVPFRHPHLWRRFIAESFVRAGLSLELASKYLGHKHIGVTFTSYFHPDIEQIGTLLPNFRFQTDANTPVAALNHTAIINAQKKRILELEQEVFKLKAIEPVSKNAGDQMKCLDEAETREESITTGTITTTPEDYNPFKMWRPETP